MHSPFLKESGSALLFALVNSAAQMRRIPATNSATRHGEQYRIDDPEGENIICVEDFNYIASIIDSVID